MLSVFLSNATPTTYNNNWSQPGPQQEAKALRLGAAPPPMTVLHHYAYCQHGERVGTSTQRREEVQHDSSMTSRHLVFNMVAELRINNWATTSESVQAQSDIRTSESGTTGQQHQMQDQLSSQRPGGPTGVHRGGITTGQRHQFSSVGSVGSTSRWPPGRPPRGHQ